MIHDTDPETGFVEPVSDETLARIQEARSIIKAYERGFISANNVVHRMVDAMIRTEQ
jgi:hypothetical protein